LELRLLKAITKTAIAEATARAAKKKRTKKKEVVAEPVAVELVA
jgi:hypothetical protein